MNKDRRTRLTAIQEKVADLIAELEDIGNEEIEAFENMPESLQESDRGAAMQEASENIEYARDGLEDVSGYLESAVQ